MVSLFLVFTAFVISNIGHIRPQRTILAFVSGIFFILSGESKELWAGGGARRVRDGFDSQELESDFLPLSGLFGVWLRRLEGPRREADTAQCP